MPVVKGKKLGGHISRRDVLRAIQDTTNYDMDSNEITDVLLKK